MTDPDLIAKKLAFIESCLSELQRLAVPTRITVDVREERFVEHTLQIAIQAALDVASHVVSDQRLGEPPTNRELFDLFARAGWIAQEEIAALHAMAGFRNILVYGYGTVRPDIVRDVVEHRLGTLAGFVDRIRARLKGDK